MAEYTDKARAGSATTTIVGIVVLVITVEANTRVDTVEVLVYLQ